MNIEQLTHFVYWLQEYHNLRGIRETDDNLSPQEKFNKINTLRQEFLTKYPSGIMEGNMWTNGQPKIL